MLQAGAAVEEQELFDKSHGGFYLAVVQGFFLTYYYTRGSAFSFRIEEKPVYIARHTTPWCGVTPRAFPNPAENGASWQTTVPAFILLQRRLCSCWRIWSAIPRCVRIWNGNGAEASCQCW